MLRKKIADVSFFTHILHVDDASDLRAYQESTKDTSYHSTNFSYLSKMAPMATHILTKYFLRNGKDFSLELESDFSYDDLKNKNVIFIGQFSTLHQSESLFLNNSNVFIRKKGSFHYRDGNEDIKYFNRVKTDNSTDYAMVSFQKMENGNNVLFFSSNHDIGVIATVRHFTDKAWLKEFYRQFPENTTSFNALFKVTGFKRTDLDCTLEKIEFLDGAKIPL